MDNWFAKRTELNKQIRIIMVRHYIDLGRVRFTVTPRRISIRGHLTTIKGSGKRLNDQGITAIFREVQALPGAGRVHADFDNWSLKASGENVGKAWTGDLCDELPGEYTYSGVDMEMLKAKLLEKNPE